MWYSKCESAQFQFYVSNKFWSSSFADKILATLGEGTFGKVVKVKDLHK